MNNLDIASIAYIIMIIAAAIGQYYICTKKKIELGLILPAAFFIPSLIRFLYLILGDYRFTINASLRMFLFDNIPTLIFLLIYLIKAKERKNIKDVDKMRISDL